MKRRFAIAAAFAFVAAAAFAFPPARAQNAAPAEEAPAAVLARGEQLFALCSQCHGDAGRGKQELGAPAIAGLPAWYSARQLQNFQSGARGAHFDDISGMRMRPMSLALYQYEGGKPNAEASAANIAAVAAFVAALPYAPPRRTMPGDAQAGEQRYPLCASCHGAKGEGSKPQNAPPLIGQSDWYLADQMRKYREGIRGDPTRGDVYGAMMKPFANVLPDEKAVQDVVAYIMQLPLPGESETAAADAQQ